MICRRCGKNNPVNVNQCIYCGAVLEQRNGQVRNAPNRNQNRGHKKTQRSNTDNAIIAAITCLAMIFVIIAGVYAYDFVPRKSSFGIGGGGGGFGGGGGAIIPSSSGSENSGLFSLEASKSEFETGDSDNFVYFYATPKGSATTVELTDDAGNVIAEMKDDGLYSTSGDDFQNDGVYTAKVQVDTTKENTYYYSAIINSNKGNKSNVVKVSAIAPLTQEELSAIKKVRSALNTLRNSDAYKQMTVEERKNSILDKLNQLSQEGLVKLQSIYDDAPNNVVTYYHTSGVMAMERLEEYDGLHAGNDKSYIAPKNFSKGISKLFAKNQSIQQQLSIDAGNAVIYYAWGDPQSSKWKSYYQDCKDMQTDWSNLGLDTTLDSNVTLNDLKNIEDKNFVYIGAHGGYGTFSYEYDVEYKWFIKTNSQPKSVTIPGIGLMEKADNSKDSEYSLDLKTGRVFICNGEYGIAPAFFDKYYDSDDLEDSIFFWGSCELFGNGGIIRNDWENVLLSKSMKAFIGFHNSNYIEYHYDLLSVLVPDLIDGKTIKEALDHATATHGKDDVVWYKNNFPGQTPHSPAAYPLLRGDQNATLINLSLKNGTFEEDNTSIKGWKKTGDVRLLTKLGDVSAQEGSQMTILTTGIGSGQSTYLDSTEGSSLYQTFKVPDNKVDISFDYNIISEEPTEYVGSKFDDKFYAEILNSKGEVIKKLASETVNNSSWSEVKGINFDGGDDTVYQTGWKNINGDISDLKGQIITIRFVVFDVGDSLYDTAAVVDNVVLK